MKKDPVQTSSFVKSSSVYQECPDPNKPEYAFIGRSNVGKSSLINMLTARNKLAKVSARPGKTSLINHFLINEQWYLVDLPGYGWAQVSKKEKEKWRRMIYDYLVLRKNLMLVFQLIDVRHEPQKVDLEFMQWLGENAIPFALIFTKADKLSSSKLDKNIASYKKELLKSWEYLPTLFTSSSEKGVGRIEILQYIEEINGQFQPIP